MNDKINELYNNLDAKDKIINEQALEIARLRDWWSKTNVVIRREKELMMNDNALLYITDLEQKIELLQNDLDGANSKLSDLMKSHLKAIEYIKKDEFVDYIPNSKSYLRLMKIRCDLLQILGVKE